MNRFQQILMNQVKEYTIQDLISHQNKKYKNIFEIISRIPGYGVNMKVQNSKWDRYDYFIIQHVQLKSGSHGKIFGQFYKNNKSQGIPIKMPGSSKRGYWKVEVNNAEAQLDNGEFYSTQELHNIIMSLNK